MDAGGVTGVRRYRATEDLSSHRTRARLESRCVERMYIGEGMSTPDLRSHELFDMDAWRSDGDCSRGM